MKKLMLAFFFAAIALVSAIAITPIHASGTTTIGIESSTQQFPSVQVGSTIQVNITISNVQGLWAWNIAGLMFNPTYLNLTGVSKGPFLQTAGNDLLIWTSNSTTSFSKGVIPSISDILLEFAGASGSGVLASLNFTVLSLGTSQIAFNQTTLDSSKNLGTISNPDYQQIPCTNINADITVGSSTANHTTSTADSSNSSSASPSSPTPITQAPEFPVVSILLVLLVAATMSTLLLAKKAKLNKKWPFPLYFSLQIFSC